MAGTELAKAYVQIVPSADGIKGKLTSALGGEASAAGDAAGKTAGTSLASSIKKVVAAAGIGAALKSALGEGADLQQSLGGIETLFKDSSSKVIQNAQNAYKTAGMSANEYMETVTGFSASLLQSLAGDTNKAADVADMALTDMSDNANKMGTSMELIQNAYQGFAKQNYTMLDNLKLGYGGTKTEMERLLADAQKLTGTKYDISNLSDVYEAIHVIQEDLGIMGATADEAAGTFSGSLSAMKAAAKNVLGNLALGEDIGPSLNALKDTVFTFVTGNLFPMVGNILSSLPELINGAFSMALQGLNFIANNAESIVQSGVALMSELVAGVISALPYLAEAAINIIAELGRTIVNTDWLAVATELLSQIKDSLSLAAGEILGMDSTIIDTLAESVMNNMPVIAETISSLFSGLWDTCKAVWEGVGQPIWDAIMGTFQYVADNWGNISETISTLFQVLWEACQSVWTSIGQPIWDAVCYAVELLFGLFQEYMPQIMAFFQDAVVGIQDTWENHLRPAFDAIGNFLNTVLKPAFEFVFKTIIKPLVDNVFGSIKDAWNKVLKPVFDGICDFLTGVFTGDWNRALTSVLNIVKNIFNGISSTINRAMDTVRNVVSNAINFIREKFNFSWSLPDIKLPHISISGDFSLNPLSVPSFGIDWYADGAVVTNPTIFGFNPFSGNAMVGGEAGAEAIAPIDVLQRYIREAVSANDMAVVRAIEENFDKLLLFLTQLLAKLGSMGVFLDTGALIGKLALEMDEELGRLAELREKGVL